MTKKPCSSLALLLLLLLLVPRADATIGMCVPSAAAQLVAPAVLVNLLKAHSISMVRLLAPVPGILTALKGTGILAMVGVANNHIVPLSLGGQEAALRWLKMHVLAFLDPKQLRYLGVGNEVLHVADALVIPHVVPAMNNLHKALQQLGLDGAVKISSPLASNILGVSMPPSSGRSPLIPPAGPAHAQVPPGHRVAPHGEHVPIPNLHPESPQPSPKLLPLPPKRAAGEGQRAELHQHLGRHRGRPGGGDGEGRVLRDPGVGDGDGMADAGEQQSRDAGQRGGLRAGSGAAGAGRHRHPQEAEAGDGGLLVRHVQPPEQQWE
ncbi:unnamed protein product [Musa textilis]